MSGTRSAGRPFDIPKVLVWNAYQKVKANKGAAGVDGQSLAEFAQDEKNNLYKEAYSATTTVMSPLSG